MPGQGLGIPFPLFIGAMATLAVKATLRAGTCNAQKCAMEKRKNVMPAFLRNCKATTSKTKERRMHTGGKGRKRGHRIEVRSGQRKTSVDTCEKRRLGQGKS